MLMSRTEGPKGHLSKVARIIRSSLCGPNCGIVNKEFMCVCLCVLMCVCVCTVCVYVCMYQVLLPGQYYLSGD